jgi:hypothetical protein
MRGNGNRDEDQENMSSQTDNMRAVCATNKNAVYNW